MSSLSGRCAVVTGAAGGIGGAIVRRLRELGARVHCVDRNATGLRLLDTQGHARRDAHTAYSASKGALLAWSRTLAVELAGDGIRVNAVCPGPVDTALLDAEFASTADPAAARRQETALVPLRRLGTSPEIANVVGFLAGDDAAFVTGATWPVDGGKTAA